MGHKVQLVEGSERLLFGKGQVIMKTVDARTGKLIWVGGTDCRGDGVALPQI